MNSGWKRALVGAGIVATLALAGAVIAFADSTQVIYACVNSANGSVRIVAAQVACKPNETAARWNVTGPQGASGPQGPAGPAGPQGPPGTSGPQQQEVGWVKVEEGTTTLVEARLIQFGSGVQMATTPTVSLLRFDPATLTKTIDDNSPKLLQALAEDKGLTITVQLCKTVITTGGGSLTCVTPSGSTNNAFYAEYKYSHAHLSKIDSTTSPLFTDKAEETLTLAYTQLDFRAGPNSASVSLTRP